MRPFCKGNPQNLCRACKWTYRRNSTHDFMSLKITNQRISGLHRMQSAMGLRALEKHAQFHEVVAATARVEAVERNDVFLVAIQRFPVGQSHRDDFTLEIGRASCRERV